MSGTGIFIIEIDTQSEEIAKKLERDIEKECKKLLKHLSGYVMASKNCLTIGSDLIANDVQVEDINADTLCTFNPKQLAKLTEVMQSKTMRRHLASSPSITIIEVHPPNSELNQSKLYKAITAVFPKRTTITTPIGVFATENTILCKLSDCYVTSKDATYENIYAAEIAGNSQMAKKFIKTITELLKNM